MTLDKRALLSNPIPDTYVVLVKISHPAMSDDIRVSTATEDLVSNGEEYLACQLLIKLPTRTNSLRTAEMSVQNVDSRIGQAAMAINTPCTVYLSIVKAESPDDVEIAYPPMKMTNVDANPIMVTGELLGWINKDEPYPKIRATKSIAPGIYTDVLLEF